MRTNYLLVDLENVTLHHLALGNGGPFKVKLFCGSHQKKVDIEVAGALQALGPEAVEYIRMDGAGKNALDFLIAYYIGRLAAADRTAFFHIISKDTGFDPLVKHLKSQKILCQRSPSVDDVPLVKLINSKSLPEKVDAIVENLKRRGSGRPRKTATLENTIRALFQSKLTDSEVAGILAELARRKVIAISDGKVAYQLDG